MGDLDFEADVTGVDAAVREIERLEKAAEEAGEATEEAGEAAEEGGEGFAAMGVAVGAATVAVAAGVAALKAITEAVVEFGNELETQGGIINRFTGDINEARERMGGLVSDIDLMLMSAKLAGAGIEVTSRQMANMTVAANELASAGVGTLDGNFRKMAKALATGGVTALREFGIEVEATGDRAVDSQAAFAALEEQWGDVSSSADTVGGLLAVMETNMANAETAALDMFNTSTGLFEAFEELNASLGRLNESTREGGEGVDMFTALTATAAAAVEILVERISNLVDLVGAVMAGDFDAAGDAVIAFGRDIDLAAAAVDNLNDSLEANLERNLERVQSQAALGTGRGGRGGRGGAAGADADPAEAGNEAKEREAAVNAAIREKAAEREEMRRAEAEVAKLIAEDQANKEIDEQQRITDALAAQKNERMSLARKQQDFDAKASKENIATAQETIGAAQQAGTQIMEAFGASRGQMELWQGLADIAMSVTKFASYEYASGALFLVSAGLHFANAAQMGLGGGGTGSAGGSAQAESQAPQNRPQGAFTQGAGPGGGGGGTTVVNFNAPMAEALVGRDLLRAQRVARRRFGAGA